MSEQKIIRDLLDVKFDVFFLIFFSCLSLRINQFYERSLRSTNSWVQVQTQLRISFQSPDKVIIIAFLWTL